MVAVTAYPVAGKPKSMNLCLDFVRSCGGQIGTNRRDGLAVFYGVDASNIEVWREVQARGQGWFYMDNSVFDSRRQKQFRIAANCLQHSGFGTSDGRRFDALGIDVKPWRTAGRHIVVCPQSASFMRDIVGYRGNWTEDTLAALKTRTDREILVRPWSRDKAAAGATLAADLVDAHALVTWSSAAAVTAVLAGVPVVVMSNDCAARPMSGSLDAIEALPTPDRRNWLGVLADAEWTVAEIRDGTAWRNLT